MKKHITIFILFLISLTSFSQKSIDKLMEKVKVQNVEIMGHKFCTGDTLIFRSGTLPNGDFLCAMVSSDTYMKAMVATPHLTATYIDKRFIISKIYSEAQGLNTETVLVIDIDPHTAIWVYPEIAITKNEIVLK
jgi:hypothetical protein